ncbi:MAG TPA: Hsp20/alpha crystallin family protein [Candidatus Eisenbacteria bacterium]|nr:Hsp20/alpha crystallin family protein [Candidatus Eisenbacteria bacterium]
MALVRWTPARDLFQVQNEMNRMLDEFFTPAGEATSVLRPSVDIEEHEEGYTVRAELPGMKQEDIKITLQNDQLVIRGEKRRAAEQKGSNYLRAELAYGTFERVFNLSQAVRGDKIEATYRDGVLEVRIPKAEESKAREIPIQTSR